MEISKLQDIGFYTELDLVDAGLSLIAAQKLVENYFHTQIQKNRYYFDV